MLRTSQTCKAYYAVDVKRIMPQKCPGGIDNLSPCFIMRTSICTALLPAKRGVGGLDGNTDVVRDQGQGFARACHLEPTPGAGERCPVSDLRVLRSMRFGAGQIRDATASDGRRSGSGNNSCRLRFLPDDVASPAQTLRGRAGLLPRHKGPRRAHKLTEEVLDLVMQTLSSEPDLRTADLPRRVEETFGFSVHVRSIERALARHRKKSWAHLEQRHFPLQLRMMLNMQSNMNDYGNRRCSLIPRPITWK